MRKKTRLAWALAIAATLLVALLIQNGRAPRLPAPSPALPSATPSATPSAMPAPLLPTPSPSPSPAPSQAPTPARRAAGAFELPIEGATGYTSIAMTLRARPGASARAVATLSAGAPFRIVGQEGAWWRVETERASGYLAHRYCLINLPDVVPSIVYDATNTYDSRVVSSGVALPGITGEGLYPGKVQNDRLGEPQFIMPVLYAMAPKVAAAQRRALAAGETLVLYEAYRPYDVQMTIVRALTKLASQSAAVMDGISTAPWSLSWFAATKRSNHQRGCAIDVGLAQVTELVSAFSGDYGFERTASARQYRMPTPIHELSRAAAAFAAPVDSRSRTAWRRAQPAAAMNAAALRLQNYCAQAGLTPLASEWWHFNDLDAVDATAGNPSAGGYTLTTCLSVAPQ
ncbi:MAG: SH3 domain-containing protein [Clostridiales bacterium]|nr:SH3 domain-containing protein [Clostridiales bacterium]